MNGRDNTVSLRLLPHKNSSKPHLALLHEIFEIEFDKKLHMKDLGTDFSMSLQSFAKLWDDSKHLYEKIVKIQALSFGAKGLAEIRSVLSGQGLLNYVQYVDRDNSRIRLIELPPTGYQLRDNLNEFDKNDNIAAVREMALDNLQNHSELRHMLVILTGSVTRKNFPDISPATRLLLDVYEIQTWEDLIVFRKREQRYFDEKQSESYILPASRNEKKAAGVLKKVLGKHYNSSGKRPREEGDITPEEITSDLRDFEN
eukprot:UN00771